MKSLPILNASESFKRLNPHLFGLARSPAQDRKPATTRDVLKPVKLNKRGTPIVAVSIVTFRKIVLDDDNNVGACKALRDAIADSLGINDKDSRVRWEYGQVETRARTGTLVRITLLES